MIKKYYCFFIIFLLSSFLFCQINYERIFAIDVSKSMKKNGLDQKVKRAAKDLILDCKVGDRIILMTFGSDVNSGFEDRVFSEESIARDKEEIIANINKLEFNDQYTWMTKAFDIIGKRLKDLQKAYPDRPKRVYVFTDGLNDPPPKYKNTLTFDEILKLHFDNYNNQNTFLYIIAIDVQPNQEIKDFVEKSRATITTTTSSKELLFKEIRFFPNSYNGKLEYSNNIELGLELELINLINVEREEIGIVLEEKNMPNKAKVSIFPSKIMCSKVGEKFGINIKIQDLPYVENINMNLKFDPIDKDIIVDPAIFSINISFLKKGIIKVAQKDLKLKLNCNKKTKNFHLFFENKIKGSVPVSISIKNVELGKKLIVKPTNFTLKDGKNKVKFLIEYENFTEGKRNYLLALSSQEKDVEIENNIINLELIFFKPISLLPFFIFFLLLLIICLIFLYFYFINKLFSQWKIYINEIGSNFCIFKSYFSNKFVLGDNVDKNIEERLLIIFAKISSIINNKLYIRPLIQIDKFEQNKVSELENFDFKYKGKIIKIVKEEEL